MKPKEKLKIELKEYSYNMSDSFCHSYGTIVEVNGEEMPYHNEDVETILEQVLEHLGYEVEIYRTYDCS